MSFRQTLDTYFPHTMPEAEFVKNTYKALGSHGFNRENTIACVGVCRDEITRSLVAEIQNVWGDTFNFSSLGGMLLLGRTGFSVAHHHAPVDGGRERYVYFSLPHMAIDENGVLGVCHRPGRTGTSGACGSLIAFRQELLVGKLNLELDLDDLEQSLLKNRLFRKIEDGAIPDLVELTKIAYEVILEDLEGLIEETVDTTTSDYAVVSGIQVHGPDNEQLVWPGEMFVVKNGQRDQLILTQ